MPEQAVAMQIDSLDGPESQRPALEEQAKLKPGETPRGRFLSLLNPVQRSIVTVITPELYRHLGIQRFLVRPLVLRCMKT